MKKIQVLGPGCPKCEKLAHRVEEALSELGIACEIEKVRDIEAIVAAGILVTPGLVVDGEVKVSGRVPAVEEIKSLLGKV